MSDYTEYLLTVVRDREGKARLGAAGLFVLLTHPEIRERIESMLEDPNGFLGNDDINRIAAAYGFDGITRGDVDE